MFLLGVPEEEVVYVVLFRKRSSARFYLPPTTVYFCGRWYTVHTAKGPALVVGVDGYPSTEDVGPWVDNPSFLGLHRKGSRGCTLLELVGGCFR